jgi:ABC-type amino acid transport substrate-binding protein
MVVILSREANVSPQVHREVERAVNDGDVIIPFRIEDVKPSDHMELFLSTCHWLDAISPPVDQHIHALATRLKSLLDSNPSESMNRQARQAVVEAAGHIPEEPVASKRKPWIRAVLIATAAAVAIVGLIFMGRDAPILVSPADNELIIEPGLKYKWDFESGNRSGIVYHLRQTYSDGEAITVPLVEPVYSTTPKVAGLVRWEVQATWKEGNKERISDWSDSGTVIWYPDTLTKIRETGVLNIAIAEEAVRYVDENNEVTGFELELIRRTLTQYLDDHSDKRLRIVHSEVFAWNEQFWKSLAGSKYDIMVGGITISDQRRKDWNIEFTKPLFSYPQSFVFLSISDDPICLDAAEHGIRCRIGVKSGTTNQELAERLADDFPGVEVRPYKETYVYDTLARDLIDRELDLALMDRPYALELRGLQHQDQLEHVDVDDNVIRNAPPEEKIGIGTKVFDEELRAVLNNGIPIFRQEIEIMISSLERNLGEEPPRNPNGEELETKP